MSYNGLYSMKHIYFYFTPDPTVRMQMEAVEQGLELDLTVFI